MMKSHPTYLDRLRDIEVAALVENGTGLSLNFSAHRSRQGCEPIPLLVSDGTRGKASIFSPSAHYLDYPLLEMGRHSSLATKLALATMGSPWRAVFRATDLDRVVYVNHWLLSRGMPLHLEHDELNTLIDEVRTNYPGRALIFPGIVPSLSPRLSAQLLALGGRAVQSRTVHLLDTSSSMNGLSNKGARQTRNLDRRLYEKRLPDRVTDREELLAHVGRMRELYSQLYLTKYSLLNPQYTEKFFAILLKSNEFHVAGWFDDGGLEAFNIQLVENAVNHWSVCGYDVSAPRGRALFRLVAGEDIFGSGENVLVNWGGGNASFKKYRGAHQALEYDIVFDDHLSARRRIPWRLLREVRGRRNGRMAAIDDAALTDASA